MKALGSGADEVIFDLEDAVSPERKSAARAALCESRELLANSPCPSLVRINPLKGAGGADGADIAALSQLRIIGVVAPKAESAAELSSLSAHLALPVIALIETARGLAAARELAGACARLAFGSVDYAAEIGCRHTRAALLHARSELVLARRLAGRPGPIDGVTTAFNHSELVRDDSAYAVELGFTGKLLIHPAQIAPVR